MPKQKSPINRLAIFLSLSVVMAGLTACGGGGGGSSTASTPATSGACATASNCTLPSSVAGVPPQN
jgi:hypothetical protein